MGKIRSILLVLFSILVVLTLSYLSPTTQAAQQSKDVTYKKGTGKLTTKEGIKFKYTYYPSQQKGASVIYVPGMSGTADSNSNMGARTLAKPLNKAGFNFVCFTRAGGSGPKNNRSRGKGGHSYFPTKDGKESAAENIMKNEVTTLIEFLEGAPTHDMDKGIYLIGGSFGSMVSLVTVKEHPEKIPGVVFLSPAILPEWFTAKMQAKRPGFDILDYFDSLIKAYGNRPALAIGGTHDKIHPKFKGTAYDGSVFLKEKIGASVEVIKISSSQHSKDLVAKNSKVRKAIVEWLSR